MDNLASTILDGLTPTRRELGMKSGPVVINLAAGPGAGKSTTAAGLFNLLKRAGYECELITECAKELTYDEASRILANQLLVFADQEHRQRRCRDKVKDFLITDSPLYLSLAYIDPRNCPPSFPQLVYEITSTYDNRHYVLKRTKAYQAYGRNQSELEARVLDDKIKLITHIISDGKYRTIPGNDDAPWRILQEVAPEAISRLIRGDLA